MTPQRTLFGETFASGLLSQLLESYASNPLFGQPNSLVIRGNPFRRPIRPQDLDVAALGAPLPRERVNSTVGLLAQRMLFNIYESDLMFLPQGAFAPVARDFQDFYGEAGKVTGEAIRPTLERHLFGFLENEVDISGRWTAEAMTAFFDQRLKVANGGESAVVRAVVEAARPEAAAHLMLAQFASDFLTEASAMARNVLGSYGVALSELFKVLIDEYGYGVYETKHSTLFEKTLVSRSMHTDVHAYWQFYLGSSLALANYFHFVSRNHSRFFRYLGAVYYTEATLSHANRLISKGLRRLFGDAVDTRYFDEHVQIDEFHGRMVCDHVIAPVVQQCGESIIPEIVRGFEEFRVLQEIADRDLIDQITWSDRPEAAVAEARLIKASPDAFALGDPLRFTEPKGELSVTHVHDEDELFAVESGEIDLITGLGDAVRLSAGDAIVIPRGRLHGSLVVSDSCTYEVRSIGERR